MADLQLLKLLLYIIMDKGSTDTGIMIGISTDTSAVRKYRELVSKIL